MAIIYDNTTAEASVTGVPFTTHTFSHTITTAENRILVVMFSNENAAAVTSVTYNGVSLTAGGANVGFLHRIDTWYLLSPDSGTHNVVITYTAITTASLASAMSFSGVLGIVTPVVGISTAGNSVSETITTIVDNCVYVMAAVSNLEPTLTNSETVVANLDVGSALFKAGYKSAVLGSNTLNATKASGTVEFNLQGIAFTPVLAQSNPAILMNFI